MPLQKANVRPVELTFPLQNQPVSLSRVIVTVGLEILDDVDGEVVATPRKQIDVWPFLTPQQQQNLTNLIQNIVQLAVNRA